MKLHQRSFIVQQASIDVNKAVVEVVQKHNLTFAELVHVLASCLQSWARFEVREERAEEAARG